MQFGSFGIIKLNPSITGWWVMNMILLGLLHINIQKLIFGFRIAC